MSTTITWNGQSATVNHPRELLHFGYPTPPRQPIASWATTLARFEALCNSGQFKEALGWLYSEYVYVTIADVPTDARAPFKAWVRANLRGGLPVYLEGPTTEWSTNGEAMVRG
jgi:hypothetical protein